MIVKVDKTALHIVGRKGAARTTFLPLRSEHEMPDHQLAVFAEKACQGHFAIRTFKYVILIDHYPGEFTTLGVQLIASSCQFFLFYKEPFSGDQPLLGRDY